ncbi:hypothetical protein LJR084_001196 [Variovorax sp. LjRoot84]|uniref:hypothetical protein n=1 Tax=Variovorax sp. LjRoot84 TaxID=3342340 RepID=UPI003ECE705D
MSLSRIPPRLFFPSGNHWQAHGQGVYHRPHGDPTPVPGPSIDVYSYFNRDRSQAPHVLLCASTAPVDGFYHLTPTDARAFAANLIHAANTAETVRSALDAQTQRGR